MRPVTRPLFPIIRWSAIAVFSAPAGLGRRGTNWEGNPATSSSPTSMAQLLHDANTNIYEQHDISMRFKKRRAPGTRRTCRWRSPASASRAVRDRSRGGGQRVSRTDEPWPKRPWFTVRPARAPSTWRPVGLAPQLPRDLTHLGQGLGRDGLAEAGQAAARVDRDAAADLGVAVVEQSLGLALGAEADVLVPVELEGRGQVVDLGQVEVGRARGRPPRRRRGRCCRGTGEPGAPTAGGGVGGESRELEHGLGIGGRDRRDGGDAAPGSPPGGAERTRCW